MYPIEEKMNKELTSFSVEFVLWAKEGIDGPITPLTSPSEMKDKK